MYPLGLFVSWADDHKPRSRKNKVSIEDHLTLNNPTAHYAKQLVPSFFFNAGKCRTTQLRSSQSLASSQILHTRARLYWHRELLQIPD